MAHSIPQTGDRKALLDDAVRGVAKGRAEKLGTVPLDILHTWLGDGGPYGTAREHIDFWFRFNVRVAEMQGFGIY